MLCYWIFHPSRQGSRNFFSIPAVATHQGITFKETANCMDGKDCMPTRNSFMCSHHFITHKLIKAKTMSRWFDFSFVYYIGQAAYLYDQSKEYSRF